jgi:tetratricopeptide (TPR) repeat protein
LTAYTVSLLAKATAITLPAVLLLLDIYPLRRLQGGWVAWFKPNVRNVFWEKLPFLLLAVLFALIAVFAQQAIGALRPVQQYFVSYRVFQAFYSFCFYLWKSLLPIRLSPLYELPFDFDAWVPFFVICGAAAVSITVLLYLLRFRWPALLASWLYYVIVLAPISGVAQSGPQLAADRYSYLSCLSWAVLLGGFFFHWWQTIDKNPGRRPAMFATLCVTVLVVIFLSAATWKQTGVWRDTRTLWQHVIAVAPESSIAHYNLGRIHENDGRLDEGLKFYRRAVNINPANADAHYNLARLLAKQGMQSEAIAHYRQAVEIRPADADTHNNLGLLLARQGEIEASLEEFRKAVQINPSHARAFFNMGRVFARQGEIEKATQSFRQALKLQPDEVEILLGLGDALARQNRWNEAAVHLDRAVKLKPALPEARVALGRSLVAQGKKDEAEKHYQEALRLLKAQSQMPPSNSGKSH